MRWTRSERDEDEKTTDSPVMSPRSASSSGGNGNGNGNGSDWSPYTDPRTLLVAVACTATTLSVLTLYRRYLRRIPNSTYLQPHHFRKTSLFGKVTSVGDGDNFRLFHTPGGRLAGWGWFPGRTIPTKNRELSSKTIHVRLAGVDAPECPHFGREGQPFGEDARRWLATYLLGRRVRAHIYRRDQYERVVATVHVRRGLLRRDVGLEMLRRGLATVYEGKYGAEFGSSEAAYREAERAAKAKGVGMWAEPSIWKKITGAAGGKRETPMEFKRRMNPGGQVHGDEQKKQAK